MHGRSFRHLRVSIPCHIGLIPPLIRGETEDDEVDQYVVPGTEGKNSHPQFVYTAE